MIKWTEKFSVHFFLLSAPTGAGRIYRKSKSKKPFRIFLTKLEFFVIIIL